MRSLAEHHSLGCCGQQWCRKQWRRHHAPQAFGGNQWWGVAGWEGKFWMIWLSKVCKSVETFDILLGMGLIQIIDAKRKWWGCNFYHLQMRLQDSHPQLPFVNSAAQGDGQPAQGAEASGGWDEFELWSFSLYEGFLLKCSKTGLGKRGYHQGNQPLFWLIVGAMVYTVFVQVEGQLMNYWCAQLSQVLPPQKKTPISHGNIYIHSFFKYRHESTTRKLEVDWTYWISTLTKPTTEKPPRYPKLLPLQRSDRGPFPWRTWRKRAAQQLRWGNPAPLILSW